MCVCVYVCACVHISMRERQRQTETETETERQRKRAWCVCVCVCVSVCVDDDVVECLIFCLDETSVRVYNTGSEQHLKLQYIDSLGNVQTSNTVIWFGEGR